MTSFWRRARTASRPELGEAISFLEFQVENVHRTRRHELGGGQGPARGRARARVRRSASRRPSGTSRCATSPTGSTCPSTCSRRCWHARREPRRGPRRAARRARRGVARRALGADLPRDVRLERRAGPRVPRAADRRPSLLGRAAHAPAPGSLEHFESPTAGLAHDDDQLAQAVSEIVVRASSQPAERARARGRLPRARAAQAGARDQGGRRGRGLRAPARAVRANAAEITEAIARLMGSEEPSPSTTDGRAVSTAEHAFQVRRAGRRGAASRRTRRCARLRSHLPEGDRRPSRC